MKHTTKLAKRITSVAMSAALLFTGTNLTAAKTTVTAADGDNYAKLLQYSLYLYDANMCGDVSNSAIEWRGNCHMYTDVPGGYHDAGDHVMFGLPQGFAASTIGWSYYEFKDSYTTLGLADHFKIVSKQFTEFFKKSTIMEGGNVTRFLYQKGDGGPDHAYWGAPESQDQGSYGGSHWTTSGASDVAAEYAAALALDFLNFGDKESLEYAKALYKFSCQGNSVTTEGHSGFYDSSSYADDQAWAAIWLYKATKEERYLSDAKSKIKWDVNWVHSWNNVDYGAACVLAEETKDWSAITSYLNSQCTGNNYKCLSDWGSARYNCGLQLMALVASKHTSVDYTSWCKNQMNYILGGNGGQNYVVGWNESSPTHCHHRAASGMGDSHSDSPNKYVLVGALVGGPNQGGVYVDQRYDEIGYQVNEVALDYQACLVGAAAGLYDKFKTGSTVTSITGVKSVNVNPQQPDPTNPPEQPTDAPEQPTDAPEQPTDQPQNPTDAPTPGGETKATVTEKLNDEGNTYWSVDASGAKQVKVTFKTNSDDTEANGAFNPPGGWNPDKWTASPSGGTFTLTYDNTNNYQFIDIHVWWPQSCTLVEAVKIGDSSTPAPTEAPTEKPTEKPTEAPTEAPNPDNVKYGDVDGNGKVDIIDIITLNKNLLTGAELTEAGKINADVNRNGRPDEADALAILQFMVGIIQNLPV